MFLGTSVYTKVCAMQEDLQLLLAIIFVVGLNSLEESRKECVKDSKQKSHPNRSESATPRPVNLIGDAKSNKSQG